jgi:hypothetical protein
MRRLAWVALALISFMLAAATRAQAEKRVAFVVGVDKYDNLGPQQQLQRAVNDARAVSAALASIGFEVLAAENVGRGAFNAKWQQFLDTLQPDDTAAIYFSGHGIEIEGSNFLLPRDVPNINFGRQEQLKRESLSVSEMLMDLRKRKPQVVLVILDACRDNPLVPSEQRSLSWGRGLARIDAPAGTFIMYSTGAGEVALDRLPGSDPDKTNSIYTRKLLPLMRTPALPLHELARQLRFEVHNLAATVPHVQQPAYYDGLIGKFCLAGCAGADNSPTSKLVASRAMVAPARPAPASSQQSTGPTYLKCSMKGGAMDGETYSFAIDAAAGRVTWGEAPSSVTMIAVDEFGVGFEAKVLGIPAGWPAHDMIVFRFNRITMTMGAALIHTPSGQDVEKCQVELEPSRRILCTYQTSPSSSSGKCEVIARPEDVVSMTPTPPIKRLHTNPIRSPSEQVSTF